MEDGGQVIAQDIIEAASEDLLELKGNSFNVIELNRPNSIDAAINLSRIISKLSPLVGNLIEFNTVEYLNEKGAFSEVGHWKRQDPGFPDAIFEGSVDPLPGFEIKAWFPLATEITARFKDSQNHFLQDNIKVVLLAWLPEFLIFGRPEVVDVCIVSGKSVAYARDTHYHNPPDYLVLEPEDTSARTANLQQTNTNGYKWQGTPGQLIEAKKIVSTWGQDGRVYKPTPEYQEKLVDLSNRFKYRLDTNYAKIDRIQHNGIELFKKKVLMTKFRGLPIGNWAKVLGGKNEDAARTALEMLLSTTKAGVTEPLAEPGATQTDKPSD